MSDASGKKARALGINHVVLEVGDLDEALKFYGAIFEFNLRGKSERNAFIDLGDQFIQLSLGKTQSADDKRHFGFVWGNRIEVVPYDDIQFTKSSHVLKGMGIGSLEKTPNVIDELKKKGMAPEDGAKV